jgi:SPP1 gp7 family putative phage head morphogenesis protein
MRIKPITRDELERQMNEAELAFVKVARKMFNAAAAKIRTSVTATAGESFVSVDDASIARQIWTEELDKLTPLIDTSFHASASNVVRAARMPFPGVLDQAAVDHLAAATNRMVRFGDEAWGAVRGELLNGFTQGESIEKLTSRVRRLGRTTELRARTVARTEIVSASNAGAFSGAQTLPGEAKKEWLATSDDRTRPSHEAANGQQVTLHAMFNVGDDRMRYPGDPNASADEIVNCRCTVLFDVE